ncbi:regulatory protein, luxR family [Paraoerskovia marina]|uniref:Regulatory protein, luxR family n=2 Tax=Paraoerskovia marina TaxID=545619 RepID=A0A1H1PT25_9CELL|nr:regulatory protein, luxR family [Paraoerskovia marina]
MTSTTRTTDSRAEPQARRSGRSGVVLDSRTMEIENARDLVDAGHGAIVWTAETGSGKSTLLDQAVDAVEDLGHVVVRSSAQVAPTDRGPGRAVESLVAQVVAATGVAVADRLVEALDIAAPTYPYLPEVAAAALGEYLKDALADRTLIVVADDIDRIDALSRAVAVAAISQRQARIVLLGTATSSDDFGRLPYDVRTRPLPRVDGTDVLRLLRANDAGPVAPSVAAHLARELHGNLVCILEAAEHLDADQLAGARLLPDPLPAGAAVHAALEPAILALDETERRALLIASVSVVNRTDVLVAAADCPVEVVTDGRLADCLGLVSGRFRFVDPRVRSLAHSLASLQARTAAHAALAVAHAAAGDDLLSAWHRALSSLEGDPTVVRPLLDLAVQHLRQGEATWAHEVAREAINHASDAERPHAYELAGAAAHCAGHVVDAVSWLRRAARTGDVQVRSRTLMPLTSALTLADDQVPDDVVTRGLAEAQDGRVTDGDRFAIARGLTMAAALHVERGSATTARELMGEAERLCPGEGWDSGLQLAQTWMAAYQVDDADLPRSSGGPPDHEGLLCAARAVAVARTGDCGAASRMLASFIAELAPVRSDERWLDGPQRSVTPIVEAHLRVAQALVEFWSGDLRRAATILANAAFRLPVGLVWAGTASALARRLDLLRSGAVGVLAESLESTSAGTSAPPMRIGGLVDRALSAAFLGRYGEAATLLQLAAERERRDEVRALPLAGLDEAETWALVGRREAAVAAYERLETTTRCLPPELRQAVRDRSAAAVALPEESPAACERAVASSWALDSAFERARTEMTVGRVAIRDGRTAEAHGHLRAAQELFEEAGAPACVEVAAHALAGLTASRAPAQESDGAGDPLPVGVSAPEATAVSTEEWMEPLTERERDVARLVVRGLSNREVAERLFLSVRTVEVHLGRVFRKLDVRSRVELTVLAHGG